LDLSTLLCGLAPTSPQDHQRKISALKFAHGKLREIEPELDFLDFVRGVPPSILGQTFGYSGEDFYFTALLSVAARDRADFDPVTAAVVNRIVLQMNFQTRFIGSRGLPEAFVHDGAPELFAPCMANGNVVIGFQVVAEDPNPRTPPKWAECSHIELATHAMLWRQLADVAPVMVDLGRSRIGCLALTLPVADAGARIDTAERYASLSHLFHDDSFLVISAAAEVALKAVADLERAEPEARIVSRVYDASNGERRAVIVASGLSRLPSLTLANGIEQVCEISSGRPRAERGEDGFVEHRFWHGPDGATHEVVKLRPPIAVVASAPMPEEARRHISADQIFPHVAHSFKNGSIVSSIDQFHVTYLHFDGDGRLIDDVGESSNLPNTPIVRASTVDAEGVKRGLLKANRRIHVRGAAMPLTFTPTLHHFHSHFLLQCFPRVLILRDLGIEATILVPPTLRKKQRQMLNMVGIPDERIVVIPPDAIVQADELIVPQPWPLVFSPYTLGIYDEMARKVDPNPGKPSRRLLISREQRTSWRNMLTYDAVRQMLVDRYDFEVLRPELLSLEDEIIAYRDAAMMIGAEGAGLYSAVYARPGQVFMAIGDEDYIMPILSSAASGRNFDVGYVFGESIRADSDVERRLPAGHSDFVIDPEKVAMLIERVMASRP
jgi:hypothetical protein